MTQGEITSKGKTVTKVHNEVSTLLSFPITENPTKVSIFDKEYYLNWVAIDTVWDSKYISEPILQVNYVTILKSGKAGEKYDKREFSLSDIGKYIVGQEDVLKSVFLKHNRTIEQTKKGIVAA